jgi:hypothetical protein
MTLLCALLIVSSTGVYRRYNLTHSNTGVYRRYNLTHSNTHTTGNPLKGFCSSPSWAGFCPSACADGIDSSLEFVFVPLKDLLSGPNTFTFDSGLEPQLKAAATRDRHLVLRLWLDYPTLATGVPKFLLPGLQFNNYSEYGGGVSPDYSNATLISAVVQTIEAMGARYDGDPRIGYIQVGLLGFWGEWHCYPHTSFYADILTENQVLDAFSRSFRITQLQARRPTAKSVTLRIGYHDDSFAYSTLSTVPAPAPAWYFWPTIEALDAQEFWRTAAMGGELRPDLQSKIFSAGYIETLYKQGFDTAVGTTHASYLLNAYAFTGMYSTEEVRKANHASNTLGYELYISAIEIWSLGSGMVRVGATVESVGAAPFYYDLELGLICSGTVLTFPSSSTLRFQLPNTSTAHSIELDLCTCHYPAIAFVSNHTYPSRPIKPANEEAGVEGAVPVPLPYDLCYSESGDGADTVIVWDVDSSSAIDTPPIVLRGDKGQPSTRYSTGWNGNATNIYGGKGRMPHVHGSTVVNGGIPQNGSLATHLEYYRRDLRALIPREDYRGYCLIDYEHW